MKFSYIGLKEPINIITPYLLSFIKSHRYKEPTMPPLEIGGVYSTDYNESALFACENEMAVYTSATDLIKNSDILFCFLSDSGLKSLRNDLKGHGIQNKIFCHFSYTYDSDILDFSDQNTYVSLYVPMYELTKDLAKIPTQLFVEGYGPKYDDFLYLCQMLSIPILEISKEDKLIYKAAANFINDFRIIIDERAKKLLNIALYDSPELSKEIFEKSHSDRYLINSYDAVENSDIRYVEKMGDLFDDIGLDDISTIYASLLLAKTQLKGEETPYIERIRNITKTILQK